MFQLFLNQRRAALIIVATVAGSVAALAGCGGSGAILGSTPGQMNHAAAARGVNGTARVVTPMRTAIPLNVPIALAEDRHHNLYVGNAGTSQILIYNSKNVQLTADTISDAVDNPAGLAFDKKGNLYVVNRDTHLVTVYTPSRKRIIGKYFKTVKGNNFAPSGIAVDSTGNVWVASRDDSNFTIGEVQVFDAAGQVIHTLTTKLEYPVGIAFRGRYAWVCDSTTPSGNALTVLDAHGGYFKTVSTPNFTPTYDAQNSGGKLYVTNGLSADIAILDATGKVLKITNNKGLDLPYGIVFTSTGNFYVANVGNNTITEYNSRGALIHTIK
jgi:sugar lactone lactonase YvrE